MSLVHALVAVTLHAAPAELIVLDVDASARAPVERAARAKLGKDALDGTSVWLPLFAPPGPLPLPFTTFTEPPPAGWPPALEATWVDTLAAFRSVVGPPPYPVTARERTTLLMSANLDAANILWERYLAARGAKQVTVLRLLEEGGQRQLSAQRYLAGDGKTRTFSQPCAPGAEQAITTMVLERINGETYMDGTRPVLRGVPAIATALALKGTAEAAALPSPDDCALPKALEVTPTSPLAAALAARWARTVEGRKTSPALACTLALITSPAALLVGEGQLAIAGLQCGDLHAAGQVLVEGNGREPPRDQLTFTLLKQVVVGRCPSAAPLFAPKPRATKDAGR